MIRWFVVSAVLAACEPRGEAAAARAGRAGDSDVAGPARTARAGTILVLGTSLTAGLGLDPSEAYPAVLARRIDSAGLSYQVVNAGESGQTSAGALQRIDWLLRQPVDVFVLETGANDGLRGLSVAAMRANIESILEKVRAAYPDARLVVAGMEAPPNLGPRYTSEFREVFPEVARRAGAALVPFLLEGVAGIDSLNQGDGIHPNAAGARAVADNVWAVLLPLLQTPGTGALD